MENEVKLTKLAKCGGCGAKVGAGTLAELLEGIKTHKDENLLVGFDKSDDASVYKVSDELALVQTVDFFPPVADDPYIYGQIAAANALSDVYAMGGEPKLALNVMCVPEKMDKAIVQKILAGGYDKVYEANAIITGGHSIFDDEPKYGLAVTGFVHPDKLIKNCTANEGDALFLTKPLGLGILMTAKKAGLLDNASERFAYEIMTTLNKAARDAMVKYRVHACTDVTGFSLMGHSLEMAQGSGVSLVIEADRLNIIEAAKAFAADGLVPAGAYRNRAYAQNYVAISSVPLEVEDVLFDPQTSGGLLIAVDKADAHALEAELKSAVPWARRIGYAKKYAGDNKYISVV